MNKQSIALIIILILVVGNIFLGFKYFSVTKELRQAQNALQVQVINDEVLDFAKLFIGEVLKAETEVDFETRLKLENAVRNLDDEEVFKQWTRFVESKTENEAQTAVKNLLDILVNKIRPVK